MSNSTSDAWLSTNKLILNWQMLGSTQAFVTSGMPLLDKVTRGHDLQMTSNWKDESNWSDTHRHVYFDLSSFVIKVTNITYLQEQYRHTLSNSLQFTSSDTHQEHLLKYLHRSDCFWFSVSDPPYIVPDFMHFHHEMYRHFWIFPCTCSFLLFLHL